MRCKAMQGKGGSSLFYIETFFILAAAYDARRILRRISRFSQSPDHPVLPGIPETEYLKGFAFEMAN